MHGPYRRYIINLKSKAPTGDEMHIVYQNKELVTSGHGGYEGPQRGDWEVLVSPGPWWDGTKPQFIVTDSITPPMSQGAIFRKLADRYDLDQIWTVDVRDSWRPGSVVWVQRADALNPNIWHVWHTPITDKGKVLQTAPNDWSECGWYDDVTSAQVDPLHGHLLEQASSRGSMPSLVDSSSDDLSTASTRYSSDDSFSAAS